MNAAAAGAVARGRERAEALMVDACTIVAAPLRTGVDAYGEDVVEAGDVRYSGPCRLQEQHAPAAAGAPGAVGERPAWQVQQRVLSVPAAVTAARVGDEVTMTASLLDPAVVGRQFRVVAITAKTHLTARRMVCQELVQLPFATDEITVITPGQTTDPYNNVLPDWSPGAVARVTVLGTVEPLTGDEGTAGDGQRQQVRDRYRVRLPAGTSVTAASRLEWLGLVLDVDGDPKVWADAAAQLPLEVLADRVRG